MVYNATCQLVKPSIDDGTSDTLRKDRFHDRLDTIRCRFTPISAQRYAASVGVLSSAAWSLRLRTDEDVKPGWRVRVQRDDWISYREYEVTNSVAHGYHTHLNVSGGVG